ncbi:hypothetical protein LEP1GSC185_0258 [Leptospira licerasiae serovar Varillal str. VAR 010]|uniref:DedA family protein n=1 Tax=Leptospira licerasiae str. MMD4847 TaxID=1049971 RepID=A0ABP2RBB9_9LEPT|nr:hypothetical protein LEP1GSC185_0258 [Leptospira licerasiae serovar Varillal str. VAR 010]EJZ40614.1 hypothetical protein LEP1GSC178_1888 [Leptospira licerasiae str. MMD4847]
MFILFRFILLFLENLNRFAAALFVLSLGISPTSIIPGSLYSIALQQEV